MTMALRPFDIDVETLAGLLRSERPPFILDVREPWELEICAFPTAISVPLGALPTRADILPKDETLIVVCHHGVRSAQATAWLRQNGFGLAVNLEGGIDKWARTIDSSMRVY